MFVLVSGEATVTVTGSEPVARLHAGDIFGETC